MAARRCAVKCSECNERIEMTDECSDICDICLMGPDDADDRTESKSACDTCGRRIGQIHEILDGVCELCRDPGAHDALLESMRAD